MTTRFVSSAFTIGVLVGGLLHKVQSRGINLHHEFRAQSQTVEQELSVANSDCVGQSHAREARSIEMLDRRQRQKRNGKRHGDSANDELLQVRYTTRY